MAKGFSNLVKIVQAVSLLSSTNGTTIKSLMEHLKLSKRSVFRLLEALTDLGFPITDERICFGGEKTYTLVSSYVSQLPNISLPSISFTTQEKLFLEYTLNKKHPFPDLTLEATLLSIRNKIMVILNTAHSDTTTNLENDPLLLSPESNRILKTVHDALSQYKACTIKYLTYSSCETRSYTVHPLKLVEHRGGLYLFVILPDYDLLRLVAVDRIDDIVILDNTFTHPADFDADKLLASSFDLTYDDPVTAVIRFSRKVAPTLKDRRYSISQSIEKETDGSIILTLTTSGRKDLLRWILSFGSEAEILSPPDLRAIALKELSHAIDVYSKS